MNNLMENLEFYNFDNIVNIPDVFIYPDLQEKLISEIDFQMNRAMYVLYKNYDLNLVGSLLNNLGEKSIVLYFYDDFSDLFSIFSNFSNSQLKSKFFVFSSSISKYDNKIKLDMFLNNSFYTYTNIIPVMKLDDNLNYIKNAREIIKYIREKRDSYSFKLGNDANDTLYGFDNRIKNIEQYSEELGLKDFIDRAYLQYKKKPAVIVSSGPSLDKNVHLLREYQDKVLIFSCDGSYTTLIKNGIIPHFIGSVERVKITYDAFYEGRNFDSSVILLAPAVVRPEIPRKFQGRMLSFFKDKDAYGVYFDNLLYNQKGCIWCGSSVAHLLYNAAKVMGADPIILIGQDLSYTMEGISHADDSEVKEIHDISNVSVWLKGNFDKLVPSDYLWEKFLLEFIEIISENPGKTINATEGGAFIEGTEVGFLNEVLAKYAIDNILKPIELFSSIPKRTLSEEIKMHIKEKLSSFLEKYVEHEKTCFKALENNVKILKKANKGIKTQKQLDEVYDLLEYVDQKIVKEIMKDSDMMMLSQYLIHSAIRQINDIGVKSYNFESIIKNLEIHHILLKQLILNYRKMIKLMNDNGFELSQNYDWLNESIYEIDRM